MPSNGRGIAAVTVAAVAWLLALTLGWVHVDVGPPAQRINIRWAPSVSAADRIRVERELGLGGGKQDEVRTWSYLLRGRRSRSRDNIVRMVSHPWVEDTAHLDRTTFRVQLDRPDMAPWLRSLAETDLLPLASLALALWGFSALWLRRNDVFHLALDVWKYVTHVICCYSTVTMTVLDDTGIPHAAARRLGIAIMLVLLAFAVAIVARPAWLYSADGRPAPLTWALATTLAALLLARAGLAWRRRRRSGVRLRLTDNAVDAILLVGVFGATFLVRLPMTSHALPYSNVWDEVVTYTQSLKMLETPGLRPYADVPGYGKSSYGDLVAYVATAGEVVGLLDGLRTGQVASLRDYLAPPAGVPSVAQGVHPSGIPLRYPRLLFAAINSLAPLLVFILLRQHFGVGRGPAVAAALLLGVMSRDALYYSSFILPDALGATLAVGALLAALRGMEDTNDRLRYWIAVGFVTGMVLSVAVRLLMVVLIPALALALARNRERLGLKAACGVGAMAAGFVLTSPYAVLDLPEQLQNIASLYWGHDQSWPHRLSSLTFYLGGMFMPGFHSVYSDTDEGSAGFGVLAGLLAWLGLWRLMDRQPRHAVVIAGFAAAHFYLILAIVERYTRHALVLYPIVCVLAGVGIGVAGDALKTSGARLAVFHPRWTVRRGTWEAATPWLVTAVCLAAWAGQFRLTIDYARRFGAYQPSQVQVAAFLGNVLKPGDKVGILDIIPWVEADLVSRKVPYVRVPAEASVQNLRDRGVTHVVGVDVLRGQYARGPSAIWMTKLDPHSRLAVFGEAELVFAGYPSGNLRIFVSALPPDPAALAVRGSRPAESVAP